MTVAERLHPADTTPGIYECHVRRYLRAIRYADRIGGVWLDAACGTGYGTEIMAAFADRVIGIDHDASTIRLARRQYRGKVRAGRLAFWCYDLCKPTWIFTHGGFDVVVSVETLEHVPADRQLTFVRRIAEALADDGVAVITCPLGHGPNPKNPYHLHEPNEVELRALVSDYFTEYRLTVHEVLMTTGDVQPNAYVTCRCPRASLR